jgi:starch-binding outer membrane protein, SusD/RagB family
MKMKSINIFISFLVVVVAVGCNKVLDKKDLAKIPPELVFNDSNIARLNLDNIYEVNLPVWGGGSNIGDLSGIHGELSEETSGESKYFEGTVTNTSVVDFGVKLDATNNWGRIRTINMFIEAVQATNFEESTKNSLIAQALFFRAWRYFDLVRIYGGVPLVLTPMEAVGEAAKEADLVPRNSTSECIKQIVADLDVAIQNLPGKYVATTDWGRITKGAAAAFKGRVLLTYASPQFNPNDLADRWQAAYDANLQAKTILDANGFGLHASYDNMWFTEANNPEAVMVTGYNDKTGDQVSKNNGYDNSTRPSYLGTGGGSNQPTWELAKAYPMKDGKAPGASTTYTYSDQLFYKNRDPRFDKTIAYNGCTWPINGNANYRLWTYLVSNKSVETKASNTGFYCRKAIMTGTPINNDPKYAGTDWMEIRYAEVLLNLAESAAGIGRIDQANEGYQGLIAVRKRAGITANSDGLYGLTPGMSRAQLFDAILFERQIEFAFEGKRFWDLRRWKKFETVLNGKRRNKIVINLKSGSGIPSAADFANPASPKYRDVTDLDVAYTTYFQVVVNNNPYSDNTTTRLDSKYSINWKPEYYFFPIPLAAITNNPNLDQNNNWGGGFDPLK